MKIEIEIHDDIDTALLWAAIIDMKNEMNKNAKIDELTGVFNPARAERFRDRAQRLDAMAEQITHMV